MSEISLKGQRVIITGAGVAIGRAHALEFAGRGAAVLVNDLDRAAADEVVDTIRARGGTARANYDAVGSKSAGESIVRQCVDELGGVEIVLNNAGVRGHNLFEDITEQQVKAVMDVHLMASLYVTQPAWKIMQKQRYGRILMTSSSSGLFSHQGLANYAAAKAGVFGLTKALSYEGEDYNINVNVILPFTPDPDSRKPPIPNVKANFEKYISPDEFRKLAGANRDPEMIAYLAAWLCSPECDISGEAFSACNGRYGRVFVGIADGWLTRAGDTVSAEAVRDHMDQIRDISAHSVPKWLYEEVRDVARRL